MEEVINNLDFISYTVNEECSGVRIDKALAALNPSLSRTQIQTLIDEMENAYFIKTVMIKHLTKSI